jgi:hypothetical protein
MKMTKPERELLLFLADRFRESNTDAWWDITLLDLIREVEKEQEKIGKTMCISCDAEAKYYCGICKAAYCEDCHSPEGAHMHFIKSIGEAE